MNAQTIPAFNVIGIAVRTTNENLKSAEDIPALWNRFMSGGIMEKIPNKIDNAMYCIYTEYEKDHTRPYTSLLGCRVSSLDKVPDGMVGKTFGEAGYTKHVAKGNLLQGAVFEEWVKIWNSDIDRLFIADFEVYDERAMDREHAEVDIFVGIKA